MATLLYIHGFLSSPQSFKAQVTQSWLAINRPDINFVCPALSSYPSKIKETLELIVEVKVSDADKPIYVIGSSLGGFWANYLIENNKANKAVLVNPAVLPQTRFEEFIDEPLKSYYSDEVFTLTQQEIDLLAEVDSLEVRAPEKYFLMAQKGDETLDYRLAKERFRQCRQLIEDGGSHTFEGFEKHLPSILAFFESA